MFKILPFVVCAALAGCTSINPITALRLSAVNPLNVDPSALRVYVDVPESIGVQNNSVMLTVFGANSVLGLDVKEDLVLAHARADDMHAFKIAATDVPKLRALQTQFEGWKQDYPDTSSGGVSVWAKPCFETEQVPLEALEGVFSVLIETDPDVGPLSLLRNVPLRRAVDEVNEDTLPLCQR